MLDDQTVAEGNYIARYRLGLLDAAELDAFEEYLFANFEAQELLELDLLLERGMRDLRDVEGVIVKMPGDSSLWRRTMPLAAGVLLALLVGSAGVNLRQSAQKQELAAALDAASQPQGNVPVLTLLTLNSTDTFRPAGTLRLVPDATRVMIILQLDEKISPPEDDSEGFGLTITTHPSGETVASLRNLYAVGDGDLVVSLPASRLAPGDYIAQVTLLGESVQSVPFSVIKN